MLQLYPAQQPVEQPIYDSLELPARAGRPYVLLNMIGTLDGKALVEGRVQNLGDATDQYLMRVLRAQVDAVLNGAGTLRAHQLNFKVLPELAAARTTRGQRARLYGVVLSRSLDLPLDNRFFRNPVHQPIVVTCAAAPRERRAAVADLADVLEAGDRTVDIGEALRLLQDRYGIRSVLSEGGPAINYPMLADDLIDELFLTLAPKVEGGRDTLAIVDGPAGFPADALPQFRLRSVFLENDTLFLRYLRASPTRDRPSQT